MGVEVDRRKRARLSLPKKMRDKGVVAPDLNEERIIPNGFLCPLTMEAMFDPVLDAEGNTFERASLIQWLKQSPTSPISRQPLSKRMVIANNALRDAIHEFMGPSWVQQKIMASIGDNEEELKISAEIGKKADEEKAPSRLRSKIDCFLQNTCNELGGLNLQLNKDGCCAFRYDNITIVLDVPDQIGVFCLYTKDLLQGSNLDQDALCKRAMELNFLQGKKDRSFVRHMAYNSPTHIEDLCLESFADPYFSSLFIMTYNRRYSRGMSCSSREWRATRDHV